MTMHSSLNTTKIDYDKDRPKALNPVKIMDLSLRDGHQSLFSTRGRTEDMIPVAEIMDEIGFWAVETWGGATFDTMHRFLNEDPWERLRVLNKYFKKTPMSMLLRGQNLVGYRNYADDLVTAFIEKSAENGMAIFRTFDALNDFRNFESAIPAIKKSGRHFQGCICYTLTEPRLGGEVYNLNYFISKAKDLESMGADSICIKDMAGLLAPYDAYDLIKGLKENVLVPVHLHTHFTSGLAPMTHLKAIEAGVDIIDTCMSPYAYRTSHPAIEPLVMTLLGTDRDTGFDIGKLGKINEILEKDVMPKYRHLLDDTKVSIIDINVLLHQTPGGMLSNFINQLKESGLIDRLDDFYKELPRVRKELGQPPLVTPSSQIIGTQAMNNVIFDSPGERYKMITDQVKDLCFGLYGKTPVEMDPEVRKRALTGYQRGCVPIKCRPADILEPELKKAALEIKEITEKIEDQLLYAMFPVTGKKFLKGKYGLEKTAAPENNNKKAASVSEHLEKKDAIPEGIGIKARSYKVAVGGDVFEVWVDDSARTPVLKNIRKTNGFVPSATSHDAGKSADTKEIIDTNTGEARITAPMPGMVVRYEKKAGDTVKKGETVVILEAMKMENAIASPVNGIVGDIEFSSGDPVAKNSVLAVICYN